jgi:hypothetical protein
VASSVIAVGTRSPPWKRFTSSHLEPLRRMFRDYSGNWTPRNARSQQSQLDRAHSHCVHACMYISGGSSYIGSTTAYTYIQVCNKLRTNDWWSHNSRSNLSTIIFDTLGENQTRKSRADWIWHSINFVLKIFTKNMYKYILRLAESPHF